MYTIGEFAAFGRVSVRMLRHYDAIGLLPPSHVDTHTGYRWYADEQLIPLLRIVELRSFGCSLDDIAEVLRADDEADAMRAVLGRRHAALSAAIADEQSQLAAVESRLRTLEGEPMSSLDIVYRRIEPVTVYAASGTAAGMGPAHVGPVIGSLLGPLRAALDAAGAAYDEPGVFWYEPVPETDELRVHVSWVASGSPTSGPGYEIVELPAIERAATTRYRGPMSGIGDAWLALTEAAAAAGEHLLDPTREVYLEADGPEDEWLTELIIPVARR